MLNPNTIMTTIIDYYNTVVADTTQINAYQAKQVANQTPENINNNTLAIWVNDIQFQGTQGETWTDADDLIWELWTVRVQLQVIFCGPDAAANCVKFYYYARQAIIGLDGEPSLLNVDHFRDQSYVFNGSQYIQEKIARPLFLVTLVNNVGSGSINTVEGTLTSETPDGTEINQQTFEVQEDA